MDRFSDKHNFAKPNDLRALQLMDHAARDVMEEYPDIVLGFGESDEFSFLLRKSTELYNRRQSKITSTLTSLFTSSYVFNWPKYFPDNPLQYPPSFDGRIVLYPSAQQIRDYFAWRQADTHINNLYNTVFWALVQQSGETTTQAHATLRGTVSKEKHEILFTRFQVNYNQIDERYRKGSVLVREEITEPVGDVFAGDEPIGDAGDVEPPQTKVKKGKKKEAKPKTRVVVLHCDVIRDEFWEARPSILNE
ncbi:hypothetical protein DXG03_004092 [Asterophora parasitica]|uniref:tRNA(His) guanylyltransferase n=1 Tax=Asterophora parasitica TaxID=117018 RepID=A0A9P7G4E3_9AGAR|nr:hypothetical protein DXG03_004092 [Asterophora parasitica]